MDELLTPRAMGQADQLTISTGLPGSVLMERAGSAVAEAALAFGSKTVLVLCGPGNNGGDGYVAARCLDGRGLKVSIAALGGQRPQTGDAALAAQSWSKAVHSFEAIDFSACDLVIDALFGAGLARPVTGDYAQVIRRLNAANKPVLAVDVPSGVDGLTGRIRGEAVKADRTISFFRFKPGHYLYPGRALCGVLSLAQIGISEDVLSVIKSPYARNHPALWYRSWPDPAADSHKYHRGHVLVLSGGIEQSGAARLSALAALRGGAGLVTLASPSDALTAHAAAVQAIMVRRCDNIEDWQALLSDTRRTVLVIGPGLGLHAREQPIIRAMIAEGVRAGRKLVLDAGALSAFDEEAANLKACLKEASQCVITPHEGEFARLFKGQDACLAPDSKAERALAAAQFLGCVVVLKGADTVIASPEGSLWINDNAPPWLGTAGSGDVLAGLVGAFLAQNVPPREASAMAVYAHGLAGQRGGRYLTADDLPALLQPCLQELAAFHPAG
jgi:hydroxyethylthiazole kinase-like uncharacterized protein yjeF